MLLTKKTKKKEKKNNKKNSKTCFDFLICLKNTLKINN